MPRRARSATGGSTWSTGTVAHQDTTDPMEPLDVESLIEEEPEPRPQRRSHALIYVLLWYAFSISLSVYNKWMFGGKGLDFPFPVLTTALHQAVQSCLAALALWMSRHFSAGPKEIRLDWREVIPTVLASSGDIGLANTSMKIVTLSFYTMVKSSALGFVLFFGVVFGVEQASWRLAGIIAVLSLGVTMMVTGTGAGEFHLIGLLMVLGASASSGLRWALVKLMLGGTRKKGHPIQTILAISPGMFLLLFLWGLLLEGPSKFTSADLWKSESVLSGSILLLFPGVLAFCMTWSEFELLNITGPLTLAIAGICKEVATIIISVIAFHDTLTVVNVIGLGVTIVAIGAYHHLRHSE